MTRPIRSGTALVLPLVLVLLISLRDAPGARAARAGAGDLMVLVRGHALHVRNAEGTEQVLLRTPALTFPRYPVWSPDGERIAYALQLLPGAEPSGSWGDDLYVVEAQGGTPRLVLVHDEPGTEIQGIAWTPDGASVLVGYARTLVVDGRFQGLVQRIDRVDAASGERRPVVDEAAFPSVSREGQRMAFLRQDSSGKVGLWVAAIDGRDARPVLEQGGPILFVLGPRISPDGSVIAFAAVNAGGGAAPAQGLADVGPRWAEARGAFHGLPMDIWRVDVTDGSVRRLTELFEDDPYPAWSPDGATLSILGALALYQVDADGSNLRAIGEGWAGGQLDVR